ncbi:MAG TPA: hypothetical protein PKD09_14280 [Aggregatilinea sp.]|uniref:hypothetical protein n=1 Tax=Aggregatilinea sp. TaxID=2806333 RepID=UPI002BBC02B2|nr:hypothetical protein [Aggregatilinea sp.]HML22814.1 hypothetical protein [Aggregatilinea sp.]
MQANPAALTAMRRAGYRADASYVQVADIGLLAYRNTDDGKVLRSGDVLMDTKYLRPFAELWLPYDAAGSVRFEIADADGRLRYADEEQYELQRGVNTILPGTWLPLEGKAIEPDEQWTLRLRASDTLLAAHPFGWEPVGGGVIQRFVAGDGELSPALREAIMRSSSRSAMSLSELLSDQDE